MRASALAVVVLSIAAAAFAETWKVGPNEEITKISAIAGQLKPGDTVEVTGDIVDSMRLGASGTKENPIVILGIGPKRPAADKIDIEPFAIAADSIPDGPDK